MIANGGTSVYGGDPGLRLAERSTAAHNTVEVDEQSSSEVWAEFRVARRARIRDRQIQTNTLPFETTATHDGFRRFGGPLHKRRWMLGPNQLTIEDELNGSWRNATARLRILPPFRYADGHIKGPIDVRIAVVGGEMRREPGLWASEFGQRMPCDILCVDFASRRLSVTLTWGV